MIAASRPLPDVARYGGSLALVLAIHAVAILVALNWKSTVTPPPPPPAMMMELAPLPEPQPLPPPVPVVQPPQPVEEPPLPKVVEAPKPVIELPKPKPKPKPQPPKPQPKPEPPKETPVEQPAQPAPAAPAKAPAPTPPPPPAPPANAAPSWESEVLGRLGRFKEYPPAARSRGTVGQVMVEFTMDGQGRVLDASIFTSSGSSLLDRAALRAVNRAQPLPIPPADKLSNGTVKLKAPFNFSLTH